jgi:hypothetical protein
VSATADGLGRVRGCRACEQRRVALHVAARELVVPGRGRPGRRAGCRENGGGDVPGQLALVIDSEAVVPAAVWEALPPERQLQVVLRLARLLARFTEAARDE